MAARARNPLPTVPYPEKRREQLRLCALVYGGVDFSCLRFSLRGGGAGSLLFVTWALNFFLESKLLRGAPNAYRDL